ncbi:MAG: ABC transporter ATP-binding protein [Desulfurococcaceae archaeon]|nr:MAG: ABC transporter ATP-binding protein [Desulfurococcaceae archaeon]
MPSLHVRSLDVFYEKAHILKGVSIDVAEGSITALIGPNGSGKTTLLKTISGLVKPVRGSISYDNVELVGREPHEIVEIGIIHVPEGRRLFPYLSVYENLKLGSYSRRARERFRENLEKVLSIFPLLRDRLWQKAGTLSGGEQQMLAIARALMAEPRVLLIDEPSLGLAPKIVDLVYKHIEELRSREKITMLIAEQNAMKAFEVSDHVYVLEIGRVIKSGKPSELAEDEEVKKAYLGI